MERFMTLISFLTRFPVKTSGKLDSEFHKSAKYFPVVGMILGLYYFFIVFFSNKIFDLNIVGIIFVISNIIITGGLHLDGLGDTFDGLYSYKDKDRILEIMKDSRLGTNALLSVLMLVLLKISLGNSLISKNILNVFLFMPIAGKYVTVYACYIGKPAKKQGMGNSFIGKIQKNDLLIASLFTISYIFLVSIIFFSYKILLINSLVLLVLIFLTQKYVKHVTNIIDGLTGDILGAICELSELLYLLLFLLFLNLGQLLWL